MIPIKCYLQTFPFNQKKIAIKSIDETNNYSGSNTPSYYLRYSTKYKQPHKQIISPTSGAGTAYPSGAPEFTPPSVFSGVHVTRSLVSCVCFVNCYVSFCTLSFGHCVVCSSIYGLF